MNKIFIPLFLIFILVFSITYFVNAQDEPQESPVTGFFQTENSPPGDPTAFAIKDFWSVGSGTVYDNGDGSDGTPEMDTHITYNHNYEGADPQDDHFIWTEGTDPDQDPSLVKTLICISSTSLLRDNAVPGNGGAEGLPGGNADTNCDILNKFTYSTTGIEGEFYNLVDPDDSAFDYSSTDVTYYARLVTCDGYDVTSNDGGTGSYSTYVDEDIHVLNTAPNVIGDPVDVFNTATDMAGQIPLPENENTHSTEAYFDWPDGTDPDDGLSGDHYPADILTYNLQAWDVGETTQYLGTVAGVGLTTSDFTGGVGTWDSALIWDGSAETAPGSGVSSLQYAYKLYAVDNGNLQTEKLGNFNLYDNIPTISAISISDYYGFEADLGGLGTSQGFCGPAGGCVIQPHDNREYATFNVTTYINEPDQDCEIASHSLYLHLCDSDDGSSAGGLGPCDDEVPTNVFLSKEMDSLELASGATCAFTFDNYLGETDGAPPFYLPKRVAGTDTQYEIFVNISSHSGVKNSNDHLGNNLMQWEYNAGRFLHLTDASLVDFTTVRVGSATVSYSNWNQGDEEHITRNWGNIVMDSEWTATTNFFNPAGGCPAGTDTWTIYSYPATNEDFVVDDDTLHPEGVETDESYQTFTGLATTSGAFTHSPSGIILCTSYDCTGDTGAVLDTYFHIRPTTSGGGFCSGEYQATLEFTDLEH